MYSSLSCTSIQFAATQSETTQSSQINSSLPIDNQSYPKSSQHPLMSMPKKQLPIVKPTSVKKRAFSSVDSENIILKNKKSKTLIYPINSSKSQKIEKFESEEKHYVSSNLNENKNHSIQLIQKEVLRPVQFYEYSFRSVAFPLFSQEQKNQ